MVEARHAAATGEPIVSTCQAEPRADLPTRQSWPQSSAMPPLAALPTVPAVVRAFVRAMLTAWHMDSLTEDAELIASELGRRARSYGLRCPS
jgi:hypothetical protein